MRYPMASPTSSSARLESIVVESCVDLFAAYGVTLTPAATVAPGDGFVLCGVIGFAGDHTRGMLMLALSERPLAGAAPPGADAGRSWTAELVNQLLGRVKNRALAHGVLLSLAMPLVLRGQCLAPVPRVELNPYIFVASTGGDVCLWVELEADAEFSLATQALPVLGAAVEGDAILF